MRVVYSVFLVLLLAGCMATAGRVYYSTGHLAPDAEFSKTQMTPEKTFGGKYFVQPLNTERIYLKTIKISQSGGFINKKVCNIKVNNKLFRNRIEGLSKNILSSYFRNIEFGVVGGGSFELYGDNLDGLMSISLAKMKPEGRCTGTEGALNCSHSVQFTFKSQYKTRGGVVKSFEVSEMVEATEHAIASVTDACPSFARMYEENIKRGFEKAIGKIAQLMGRDITARN